MSQQRLIAGMVFLAAVGFLWGAVAQPPRTGPRLDVSPEIDLGELLHDRELGLAIGFRNAGDEPLHVSPPIHGCECALATLDRDVLQPGESGRFRFTLRPAAPAGSEFAQQVVVPSNDREFPRRIVTVRGSMQASLFAQPAVLRIGPVPVGESWRGQVSVTCSDPLARFEIVSAQSELVECSALPRDQSDRTRAGDEWERQISVLFPPDSEIGRRTGQIRIHTNHPRYRHLNIPVEVEVASRVRIRPATILFDGSPLTEAQTIELTSPAPLELTYSPDTTTTNLLEAQFSRQGDGSHWNVVVRLVDPPSTTSPVRGILKLAVSGLPHEEFVQIPYTVLPPTIVLPTSAEADSDLLARPEGR